MVMASPPLQLSQSSAVDRKRSKYLDALVSELADGKTIPQIAREMAKGDEKKAKYLRGVLRNLTFHRDFTAEVAKYAQAQAATDVLPGLIASGRRARRGRTDAIKLALEVSGVHNPKVKHEHSGEVVISLKGLTRPQMVETTDSAEVVDAEVVED